jgi:DNA-binding NtrC family response regulator
MTDATADLPPRARVVLVEDDPVMGGTLAYRLGLERIAVDWARSAAEGEAMLSRRPPPDLLLCDIRLPDRSGEEMFLPLRARLSDTPVLFMTAYADIDQAVRLVRAGADDFLTKPFEVADLLSRIEALLARRAVPAEEAVLGHSAVIRRVEAVLRRAATVDSPVLLLGETGVGKEVAARLLHSLSPRAAAPFVAVNCAAIPAELMESEVLGHERGAFTGASARHEGYAERARDGTLFLDEVAELPPALQPKLLRLLEAREFHRVGGRDVIPFRARLVAATNADPAARLREDLLWRLDVIRVEIPPLRARPEDVLPLARRFLAERGGGRRAFDAEAEAALLRHRWPGNARELRNRVERAVALSDRPRLGVADLFPDLVTPQPLGEVLPTLAATVAAAERGAILAALEATGWDVPAAAERLGVGRSTLFDKIRRFGLARPGDPAGRTG